MVKCIIISTDVKFWEESQGSQNRISSLIKFFSEKGVKVIVHFVGLLLEDKEIINKKYNIEIENKFNFTLNLRKVMRKFKDEPTIKDFNNQSEINFFNKLINKYDPDSIIIEYIRLAYLLTENDKSYTSNCRTFIDTHDVMSSRYALYNKKGLKHWLKINEEEEMNVLNHFDIIIAIQETDKNRFKNSLPHKNVITTGHFHPIINKNIYKKEEEVIVIGYIAGSDITNVYSITEFIDNVWEKLINSEEKNIVLNIYGNICNNLNITSKFINKCGFVENIESVYEDIDIIINPVQAGGGLKIKNVEALCFSKPLLTTSVGAEGLNDGIDKAFMVADDWNCYEKQLRLLINDSTLRNKYADAAHNYSKYKFSVESVFGELWNLIRDR